MMRRGSSLKLAYDAIDEEIIIPQLCSLKEEAKELPRYKTMSPEVYSAWQLGQQQEQLAENNKNEAAAHTDQNTAQQHQPVVRYSNAHREQAAMQENSGSIFSSAFFHIHFR